jgi:hypothetical protein
LVSNTTLAAEAHLAEGQLLLEEQTLNIEISLIYPVVTRRVPVSERDGMNLLQVQTRITNSA